MLTHAQPIAKQQTAAPSQLLAAGILGMIFCDVEYPFGQFGSAVLAVLLPCFLWTFLLAEHGVLKSPWIRVSATYQQLQGQCIITDCSQVSLNPKHSTVPASKKRMQLYPSWNQGRHQATGYVMCTSSKSLMIVFKNKIHFQWEIFFPRLLTFYMSCLFLSWNLNRW